MKNAKYREICNNWRRLICKQIKSGEDVIEWCVTNNVNIAKFEEWSKRLEMNPLKTTESKNSRPITFKAVKVEDAKAKEMTFTFNGNLITCLRTDLAKLMESLK